MDYLNRHDKPGTIEISRADLGIDGERSVRDVWARQDLGKASGTFSMGVPAHGAQFLVLKNGR